MLKKIIFIFELLLVLFLYPLTAHALNPQVDAAYTVSAIVPSKVIKDKSEVYLNPSETLADPTSHQIFLKVTLRDNSDNPLPNLDVWIWTNRGAVDLIQILTGPDADSQQTGPNGQGKKGKTDANGEISFSISSWTPGEAVLYIKADSLIDFDSQNIKFDPLPFPAQVTLAVPLPGGGEIVLLAPPEQKLTPEQKEAKKLANIGTKITIPFWVFVLVFLWLFLIPLFIILMALSIRKIRRTERRELVLLEKIAEFEKTEAQILKSK